MENKKDNWDIDEWIHEFWATLDKEENTSIKKNKTLYCSCTNPKIVKRGFSHITYNFCLICRKESL